MGKAWFNKKTGRFEKNIRGYRVSWTGKYWINSAALTDDEPRRTKIYYDNRFGLWYERKGYRVERRWKQSLFANVEHAERSSRIREKQIADTGENILSNKERVFLEKRNEFYTGIALAGLLIISLYIFGSSYVGTEISSNLTNTQLANNFTDVIVPANLTNYTTLILDASSFHDETKIDADWVNSFMREINSYRANLYSYNEVKTSPAGINIPVQNFSLGECQLLNNYSKERFEIMTADNNYEISHYGGSYRPEVFLYPEGFTPQEYLQDLKNNAPLHFQPFVSLDHKSYGYYIAEGPVIAYEGYCDVIEIPGPNINVKSYLTQRGCKPIVTNTTWFVMEFGPVYGFYEDKLYCG